MITKKQIIAFVVALGLLIGFVVVGFRTSDTTLSPSTTTKGEDTLWPSREVDKVVVDQKTAYATVTGAYPKTASDSITEYFKSFVTDQIDQFTNDTAWAGENPNAESQSLSLDIQYTGTQATTVQTYVFTVNSYTGGAHGMQFRKTFSFNKEGQLLTISSLFNNGLDGLASFSDLVQKELLKRDGAQASWISDGASPKEENYQSFIVTDAGITVLFDPYQVAPWSDGAIDINIPVSAFKKIANIELFPSR